MQRLPSLAALSHSLKIIINCPIKLGYCKHVPEYLQIVEDGHVIAALVVLDEDGHVLHVLELDVLQLGEASR